MVSVKGVRFQAKRASGLLKLLLRNKMAAIGLVLLVIFIFMALGAQLLTPYNPYTPLAGSLAQPEWVTSFPDGYYLSKNIILVKDPGFQSPAALSDWAVTSPNGTLTNLEVSYTANVTAPTNPGGSVQIINTGNNRMAVRLTQSFHYPYNGPPKKFVANFAAYSTTASPALPIHVRLFIQRGGDNQLFNLWDRNDTFPRTWVPSAEDSLDSGSAIVTSAIAGFNSPFDTAAIVFSQVQDYTYGMEVTLSPHQAVYVDDLQLKLFGTAWGLLGTDNTGADIFTQLVYGSRISLAVGLSAAGIGIALGLLVGLLAGFLGKVVDEALMRFTDMMLVIPGLPLLIVLVAVLGQNILNVVIIIGFLGWMGFARIVRAQVLSLRERPFVEAAKASGAGAGRIISKHIFPNIVSLTYVNLALSVPGAILTESALAFIGLSDPSVVSWGNMFSNISQSKSLFLHPPPWWWVLPPGFSIALVSLSFVLIGYALDEIFNPKLRSRR